MKHKKVTALILALMMIFSTITAAAASDPAVTIISPASETVVYSDSLLLSIKITKPETIRVSLTEEKQVGADGVLTSVDVNDLEALQTAVTAIAPANASATAAAVVTAAAGKTGTAAAANAPAVQAVPVAAKNAPAPASAVTSVSGAAAKSSAGVSGASVKFASQDIMVPETFTSTNTLGFYTKQINNVAPGLYKIKVDTVSTEGKVLYSTENLVVVKGVVSAEEKTDLFESNQSGISQFLQNLLKSIFG